MSEYTTITPDELPAAHTLIRASAEGSILPLMFYYATERDDCREIAEESGYDFLFVTLDHYPDEANAALAERWREGMDETILSEWSPTVPEGWMFGGRWDTEDGPAACFLRKRAP